MLKNTKYYLKNNKLNGDGDERRPRAYEYTFQYLISNCSAINKGERVGRFFLIFSLATVATENGNCTAVYDIILS